MERRIAVLVLVLVVAACDGRAARAIDARRGRGPAPVVGIDASPPDATLTPWCASVAQVVCELCTADSVACAAWTALRVPRYEEASTEECQRVRDALAKVGDDPRVTRYFCDRDPGALDDEIAVSTAEVCAFCGDASPGCLGYRRVRDMPRARAVPSARVDLLVRLTAGSELRPLLADEELLAYVCKQAVQHALELERDLAIEDPAQ